MLTNISFKAQITWLSAGFIILTTIVLTANYWLNTSSYVEEQLKLQMRVAQNVLQQYLEQQEQVLSTSANVLAADFGFKQAVATQDTSTIQSVLLNHSRRIQADLMVLVDLNGSVVTSNNLEQYSPKDVQAYISELPLKETYGQILIINNDVYQVIVVPVKAPRTIAYSIIGFKFDHNALIQLKDILSLDITLTEQNRVIQSSIAKNLLVIEKVVSPRINSASLLLSSEQYFHQSIAFGGSSGVSAVLSASLSKLHQDFQELMLITLLVSLTVLSVAVSLSSLFSLRVVNPLQRLMVLTENISLGNFTVLKIEQSLPVELNNLYQGFAAMGTAIEQRESKIIYQAERDLLTSLFNRHKILSELSNLLKNNINIALINFNIKNFGALNDTIGIANGDKILIEIAQRLKGFKKRYQDLVVILSRTHADEFLVAIEINSVASLSNLMVQLRTELEKTFWFDGIDLNLNVYYGVANSIAHGQNAEKLIRRATMAASNAIKNQQTLRYYQDGEDEEYLYKLNLIEELKEALNSEDSPLFLTYQPKLDLTTGRVDKVEALIRWVNKDGEFVNPELFVALAENSGLIVVLTQWVIKQVTLQIQQWNELNYQFNVSINLSAQDLQHEHFVTYLLDTLTKFDVRPSQITLELTERDIAENELIVTERLTHLKTLGFQVSVDDYGIGQSSLAKLKSLPVDELKIDKCFILSLDQSQQDQDIVSSTVALGHKLGLRVVAEGVENAASLNLLKQFGCDYAQGYHLSRPQKAEQLIQWYENYAQNS